MGRSRLYIRETTAPPAEKIILKEIPWNAELKQITAKVDGVVTTSELLTVHKISVTLDTNYDALLGSFDLSIGPVVNLACNETWQFAKGDFLLISYPNTDLVTIGVEAVIKEAE